MKRKAIVALLALLLVACSGEEGKKDDAKEKAGSSAGDQMTSMRKTFMRGVTESSDKGEAPKEAAAPAEAPAAPAPAEAPAVEAPAATPAEAPAAEAPAAEAPAAEAPAAEAPAAAPAEAPAAAAPVEAPAAMVRSAENAPGMAHPQVQGHPTVAEPMPANQGKVVSVLQAGRYTYVEVENNGRRLWVAGNAVDVKEGDLVHWGQYSIFRNFPSKTLNRTFDQLVMVSDILTGPIPPPPPPPSGEVVSVIPTQSYNYIEVKGEGGTQWLAAPLSDVSAGDKIVWTPGTPMNNFFSKSLNRTFDTIVFVGSVARASN